jgi:hypothetical protein
MLKQALVAKPHALEFIKSPILAVLLQIVFAHSNTVPSSLNDFYNRVYLTLFHRHDELKTNVIRSFKTDLTCDESERVFQAFCYLSLKNGDLSLSNESAIKYMSVALKVRGFEEVKPDHYFHDVFHVTNIIQEDGYDNYTFFHRSMQEFYAYKFIDGYFSTEQKKQFFELCRNDISSLNQFNLVLRFFADNRESRDYLEFFFLPVLGGFIGSDLNFDLKSAATRLVDECNFTFSTHHYANKSAVPDSDRNRVSMASTQTNFDAMDALYDFHLEGDGDFFPIGTYITDFFHNKTLIKNNGQLWSIFELSEFLELEVKADTDGYQLQCGGARFFEKHYSDVEKEEFFNQFEALVKSYDLISLYKKQETSFNLLNKSAQKLFFDGL